MMMRSGFSKVASLLISIVALAALLLLLTIGAVTVCSAGAPAISSVLFLVVMGSLAAGVGFIIAIIFSFFLNTALDLRWLKARMWQVGTALAVVLFAAGALWYLYK